MRRGNRVETLDVFIGGVGFFTFAFVAITVVCELTGTDALGWALTSLLFLVILGSMLMSRRRLVAARAREPDDEKDHP